MSARPCREVRADLSAFLDGDLEAGPAAETRAHLEGCAACRSELEQLRLTVAALRRLPDLPPPAAVLSGVRTRLRPDPWYRRFLERRPWLHGLPVGALATLLVVVGIALFQARHPDLQKPLPQATVPVPPTPVEQDRAAPAAAPAPAGGAFVADRQVAAPRARSDRYDALAGDSTAPPTGVVRLKSSEVPHPSLAAGADKRERRGAVPAEPRAPTSFAAAGSKRVSSRLPEPGLPAEAPGSVLREESLRADERARDTASIAPRQENEEGGFALAARDADRGAGLGRARAGAEKARASARVEIVCLLPPGGVSEADVARLLRREGAAPAVGVLEPRAVREAFAPYRGRPEYEREPSQGWSVSAAVPTGSLPRLLQDLANRPGLRVLQQTVPAVAADSAGTLELHLTLLR